MSSARCPWILWLFRFHCIGGGSGSVDITKPRRWLKVWQKQLKLPVRRLLKRVVRTRKLAELGLTARAEIMRGAFRARRRSKVTGRTVLLVDDVLTTGATCGAAARALKQAGAMRVVVAIIARTERTNL